MFKTDVLIKNWTPRLLKKCSLVRNLMFLILGFGSPVYFHLLKEKRAKFGASWKKGIFVGYSENSKGYRIYVVGQKEVEISHDVTFD